MSTQVIIRHLDDSCADIKGYSNVIVMNAAVLKEENLKMVQLVFAHTHTHTHTHNTHTTHMHIRTHKNSKYT